VVEIDGPGHVYSKDREREKDIGLPTLRFGHEEVSKLDFGKEFPLAVLRRLHITT
jgi:hypothetical protein